MCSTLEESQGSIDLLCEYTNSRLNLWNRTVKQGDYSGAADIAIEEIRLLWEAYNTAPPDLKPFFHTHIILFNGLRDVANLRLITSIPTWLDVPLAIERAWLLALDAIDRLKPWTDLVEWFYRSIIEVPNAVLETINTQFGNGLYCSWEIEIERAICTICSEDIRQCSHMRGEWYQGSLCQWRIDKFELTSVSVVDQPKDLRCRIWPWLGEVRPNEETNIFHNVPVFVFSDPLGVEDGGNVEDTSILFPSVCSFFFRANKNLRYEIFAYRPLSPKELKQIVREYEKANPQKTNKKVHISTLIGSNHQRRDKASDAA